MIKKLIIRDIGTKGLNSDMAPWELGPEFISYGLNFKATANFLETQNSNVLFTTPPAPAVGNFDSGHILSVRVSSGEFWLNLGRQSVQVYDGGNWFDISSTVGYATLLAGDQFKWSSCLLGSIPIINNELTSPEYWSPQSTAQIMQPLDFSPGVDWLTANKSMKVIRSHKNFLFALNLTEGGIEQPSSYRWSHPADNNGLPFTWDETDISAIASKEQILGDSGAIVDGLTLRDSFVIYSERGVNILEPGNTEFPFINRKLSSTYGLLNKNSLVEVNGVHYFLSEGDILRNDGNKIESIGYNRIRRQLNGQRNQAFSDRSFAVLSKIEKEIWFVIAEGTSEYPSTAYVYNWDTGSWSIKAMLANTAFAAWGNVTVPPITWNTITGTYNTTNLTWGITSLAGESTVMSVDGVDGSLHILNPATASASTLNTRLERTDFPLESMDDVVTVTRIYPHMTGTSDVLIQIGSQAYPGAPVTWQPAQTFNPSTDRKLDFRTTGALQAWRVDSIDSGKFNISGITFEYVAAGLR